MPVVSDDFPTWEVSIVHDSVPKILIIPLDRVLELPVGSFIFFVGNKRGDVPSFNRGVDNGLLVGGICIRGLSAVDVCTVGRISLFPEGSQMSTQRNIRTITPSVICSK